MIAFVCRRGMTSAAKQFMLRSASSQGMPAKLKTPIYASAPMRLGIAHDGAVTHVGRAPGLQVHEILNGSVSAYLDIKTLQKFAAAHAPIHNHSNQERHLYNRETFKLNRSAALAEWRQLTA